MTVLTNDLRVEGRPSHQLDPVAFLERAATVFADRTAIIDGKLSMTYAEFWDRSKRLAGALESLGVAAGDRVATLCTNSYLMLEAHNGVPACGAVLVPLNLRLSEPELLTQLEHSGARVLIASTEFAERARSLTRTTSIALLLECGDSDDYERAIQSANPFVRQSFDEQALLSISYTSGTTGQPKGVMHTRRGAYLQASAMAYHSGFDTSSRYLWILPMFHCHGWSNVWALTAAGSTHVCIRTFEPTKSWELICDEQITHASAAPTVLMMMLGEVPSNRPHSKVVRVATGGAPPTPSMLERLSAAALEPQHLYGLTETLGPSLVNEWLSTWNDLPAREKALLHARQGVPTLPVQVRVVDKAGVDVPHDGSTQGEIEIHGDTVTVGYWNAPETTRQAFRTGWLRTGDAAVVHADGYLEIRDRLKDIIISGGENISSLEIERTIDEFPSVIESAVVGAPHPKWGEQPVAYVNSGQSVVADAELTTHLRAKLGGFKVPRIFVFGALPKTATGKTRKDILRQWAREVVSADAPIESGET